MFDVMIGNALDIPNFIVAQTITSLTVIWFWFQINIIRAYVDPDKDVAVIIHNKMQSVTLNLKRCLIALDHKLYSPRVGNIMGFNKMLLEQ